MMLFQIPQTAFPKYAMDNAKGKEVQPKKSQVDGGVENEVRKRIAIILDAALCDKPFQLGEKMLAAERKRLLSYVNGLDWAAKAEVGKAICGDDGTRGYIQRMADAPFSGLAGEYLKKWLDVRRRKEELKAKNFIGIAKAGGNSQNYEAEMARLLVVESNLEALRKILYECLSLVAPAWLDKAMRGNAGKNTKDANGPQMPVNDCMYAVLKLWYALYGKSIAPKHRECLGINSYAYDGKRNEYFPQFMAGFSTGVITQYDADKREYQNYRRVDFGRNSIDGWDGNGYRVAGSNISWEKNSGRFYDEKQKAWITSSVGASLPCFGRPLGWAFGFGTRQAGGILRQMTKEQFAKLGAQEKQDMMTGNYGNCAMVFVTDVASDAGAAKALLRPGKFTYTKNSPFNPEKKKSEYSGHTCAVIPKANGSGVEMFNLTHANTLEIGTLDFFYSQGGGYYKIYTEAGAFMRGQKTVPIAKTGKSRAQKIEPLHMPKKMDVGNVQARQRPKKKSLSDLGIGADAVPEKIRRQKESHA